MNIPILGWLMALRWLMDLIIFHHLSSNAQDFDEATMISPRIIALLMLSLVRSRALVTTGARYQLFRKKGAIRLFLSDDGPSSLDKPSRTALVWLRTALRLADNEALIQAAARGPDGLSVVFTVERGLIPSTPSAVFEYAAACQLDQQLREQHATHLKIIYVDDNNPVSAITHTVAKLRPDTVVIDASTSENLHTVKELREALKADERTSAIDFVPITDDASLVPFFKVPQALGRSRTGGRVLRWSTFLSNLNQQDVRLPLSSPEHLPPPLDSADESDSLPEPTAAGPWAETLLDSWGEVSEEEALRRAMAAKQDPTATPTTLGNRGASNQSTRLSPYLRWGILSPRQAYHAGARKRDLLWRDWSHVCYRVVHPLRRGEPVLSYLDGVCLDNKNDDKNGDDALFTAWCLGRTGSPIVDAGMRQLWYEGWLSRHDRLLAASCLVEGLGVDWRKGRDWFEHTLIDHDPAINELMWQNAGFCGVDPFYRALPWESTSKGDHEYVDRWMSQELHWPSTLLRQDVRKPPSSSELIQAAQARRTELRTKGYYKEARRVSNSGIRVAWENLIGTGAYAVASGEVWGVGRVPLEELTVERNN
jgi:deoxyribodipyrimidine photolyase